VFSPRKSLYLGYLTLTSGIAMFMYIIEVKRGESQERRLILSIISCILFFVVSLYIFSVNW